MKLAGPAAFENAMHAPNARWERSIERFARDPLEIEHVPKFRLDSANRFFCIGSCFARNIEEALIYRGVDVISKRLVCPTEEYAGRHTGIINKFTTASIVNELDWALTRRGTGAAFIFDNEQGSFDLQLAPHAPPVTRERAIERRQYIETDYFVRINDADVLVITLGLIETWRDEKTGIWQNSPPSYYMVRREPDRFSLSSTSVAENIAALEKLRVIVSEARPGIKIIVTVSPVPMDTTFTGVDVFTANLRSKSVLTAAAAEFASAHDDVDYFPSYEIVTGSSRRAAYGEDCRHVRDSVVRQIIGKFIGLYLCDAPDAPAGFVETMYLIANPDVEMAIRRGELASGFEHWQRRGQQEGRPLMPAEIPNVCYDVGVLDRPRTIELDGELDR
jgi:GSCFA family